MCIDRIGMATCVAVLLVFPLHPRQLIVKAWPDPILTLPMDMTPDSGANHRVY